MKFVRGHLSGSWLRISAVALEIPLFICSLNVVNHLSAVLPLISLSSQLTELKSLHEYPVGSGSLVCPGSWDHPSLAWSLWCCWCGGGLLSRSPPSRPLSSLNSSSSSLSPGLSSLFDGLSGGSSGGSLPPPPLPPPLLGGVLCGPPLLGFLCGGCLPWPLGDLLLLSSPSGLCEGLLPHLLPLSC